MNRRDIYERLCVYDPRNPLSAQLAPDPDDIPLVEPGNCHCDNCMYGRHSLADALLDALDRIEELEERRA